MKKINLGEKIARIKVYPLKEGMLITMVPLYGKKGVFNKVIKLAKHFEIGFIEKEVNFSKGIKEIKGSNLLELSLVKVKKSKNKKK